jgi:hypothetical protein
MSTPSGKYVPPHKREGATSTPVVYKPKILAHEVYLTSSPWEKGVGENYFYPGQHPHVHLFRGEHGWTMAYSEGKQHLGGRGVLMADQDGKFKKYAWAITQLKKHYGDSFNRSVVDNCYAAMLGW